MGMIGMFTFETLELAIKRAKDSGERSDAQELIEMVMKLTESDAHLDEVWKMTERDVLELLIVRELQSAHEPSFVNICSGAENWNSELDHEVATNLLPKQIKKEVIKGVRSRLAEFSGALTILRHQKKLTDKV